MAPYMARMAACTGRGTAPATSISETLQTAEVRAFSARMPDHLPFTWIGGLPTARVKTETTAIRFGCFSWILQPVCRRWVLGFQRSARAHRSVGGWLSIQL